MRGGVSSEAGGGNTSVDTECEGQIGLMYRLWGTERGGNSSLSERGVDRFKIKYRRMNSETEDYFYLNGETEFGEAEEIRLWEKNCSACGEAVGK